jgi:hypothetical protein
MPGNDANLIHRSLMDWYITKNEDPDGELIGIRHDIEPLDEKFFQKSQQKHYFLHGRLILSAHSSSNSRSLPKSIPIRIQLDGRWALDRSHQHRGIWVQTDIAWYWLKRPCSIRSTVKLRIKGIPNVCLEATIPSQEDLHTILRAKLGLVSNWCDLLLFDEKDPDSRTLLKRHSRHRPEQIYEELSPGPELLERYPDRSHEPFDAILQFQVPGISSFVKSHLFGWYLDTESILFNSFQESSSKKQQLNSPTFIMAQNIKWWKESAKASETRSARYPWGEPLPGVKRIDPNWVFSARLALAADTLSHAPPPANDEDDDDDDEIIYLGTIQTNAISSSSKLSKKIKKSTEKGNRLKHKRKRKLANTSNNINDSDSETFFETSKSSDGPSSKRRIFDDELDIGDNNGSSPPIPPRQIAKSKTSKLLVIDDNDSVSSVKKSTEKSNRLKHKRKQKLADTSNNINDSESDKCFETSISSKLPSSKRRIFDDELDIGDNNGSSPPIPPHQNAKSKTSKLLVIDDNDSVASVIYKSKSKNRLAAKKPLAENSHDFNTGNDSGGTKRIAPSSKSKNSNKRRVQAFDESDDNSDDNQVPEFTEPKYSDKKPKPPKQSKLYIDNDNDDDDSDSIIILEKELTKPKPSAFHRLEGIILGKTMFQSQRMLAALVSNFFIKILLLASVCCHSYSIVF